MTLCQSSLQIRGPVYCLPKVLESFLLKASNDPLLSLDCGKCAILTFLDLSVAFDLVDHCILLSHLKDQVGIQGTALQCFASYLTDRTFSDQRETLSSSAAPSDLWSTSRCHFKEPCFVHASFGLYLLQAPT